MPKSPTGEGPAVIVTASARWHPGVVGLIAARLKERLPAPGGRHRVSAERHRFRLRPIDCRSRSRPGGAAQPRRGILIKGGGHAMAAGLTVEAGRLGDLRAFLADRLDRRSATRRIPTGSKIDAALARGRNRGSDRDDGAGRAVRRRASRAVFALPSHQVAYAEAGDNGHVRVTLKAMDGATIKAVAFRAADGPLGEALLAARGRLLHVAGSLSVDRWQGRRQPSLRIVDAAEPAAPRR